MKHLHNFVGSKGDSLRKRLPSIKKAPAGIAALPTLLLFSDDRNRKPLKTGAI